MDNKTKKDVFDHITQNKKFNEYDNIAQKLIDKYTKDTGKILTFRGGVPCDDYSNFKPHTISKNSSDNGYGIYVTADIETAGVYAKGRKDGEISFLELNFNKDFLLNRDLPLNRQSEKIIQLLEKGGLYKGNENILGSNLYTKIMHSFKEKEIGKKILLQRDGYDNFYIKTNDLLISIGIKGMQYEADHVGKGKKEEHYVIFDGGDIKIIK